MPKLSLRSIFELVLANFFWGWGFVATKILLNDWNWYTITTFRFLGAFIIGMIFFKKARSYQFLKPSLLPGVLLGATLLLQTAGLQYTTATKSAFITSLYVVFVPILVFLFHGKKLNGGFWVSLILALVGSAFLVELNWQGKTGWGEFLTLLNAMTAALQIYTVGQVAKQVTEPFVFNIWSSFWTGLMGLPFLLIHASEIPNLNWNASMAFALLSLILFSTLLGFYWQVKSQRSIAPSLAALIFLLESPFAFLLALYFLQERVSHLQLGGIGLILISVILAIITDHPEVEPSLATKPPTH